MLKKKTRRTDKEIDDAVNNAIRVLASQYGFEKITFKAISLESKTEEGVLYKRYGGLMELLDKFIIEEYKYWLHKPIINAYKYEEHDEYRNNKHFFSEIINRLYEDKVLRQLLIWEISDDNPTTLETIKAKEAMYSATVEAFNSSIKEKNPNLGIILSIILGGIYYISMIKDKTTFWGTDFKDAKGKKILQEIVNEMIDTAFIGAKLSDDAVQIATNMKAKGLDNLTIAECTGLSIGQILKLP